MLQPLADNVWLYPMAPDKRLVEPNIGVITTARGTVLVDSGNSPRHARYMLSQLTHAQLPPVTYIIFTHSHWDHTFGAQIFGVPVIAHTRTRALLLERAALPWSAAFVQDEGTRSPAHAYYHDIARAVDDWAHFRIVIPTITFTESLRLYLDDTPIVIEHVGGQHAPDSVVVKTRGVAFVGDSYYPPPRSANSPVRSYDQDVIERVFADTSLHTFVDGHSAPHPRAEVAALLAGEA